MTGPHGAPQSVTHGNLVSSSILLGRQGVVKLTDFRAVGERVAAPSEDLAAVARLCQTILLGRSPSDEESAALSGVPPGLAAVLRRAAAGQLDPDALQDGLLDYSFDAGVRVTDRALVEGLQALGATIDAPASSPTTRPLGTPRPSAGEVTYRVQSGAASRLGAIPRSNFESLLSSDAIATNALVSVDGGVWQPLDRLPIYAEVMRSAVPPPPTLLGPLDAERLPEFGAHIGIARLTGCLRAERGDTLKQFWFRRGIPVRSTSTQEEELLGPCMVRAGLIDDAALQAARAAIQSEGGLFGAVLLRHGLCSAGALHRGLEEQLQQRFYELLE
ncbi:MAG: hypothetical protein VX747_05810, partial [Actinomycetota bacterium]|nr:hypothetical protein [Actinomycetota bacterium]